MTPYLFLFGKTPELSLLELRSLFPQVRSLAPFAALLEAVLDPNAVMRQLGGTIKIAKVVGSVARISVDTLVSLLMKEKRSNHLTFGVSRYDTNEPISRKFLGDIKDSLESLGIGARFIEARSDATLGSVVVVKQDVVDLVVVRDATHSYLIARTVAVQLFEEWNRRDYGRPYADPKRGMLPPKVARMVVNIGKPVSGLNPVLLDPFCGMGTILAEALLTGWTVLGSDQSPEVIQKAESNLRWLAKEYPSIDSSLGLYISDATHISEKLKIESVDAIVTEPYLGPSEIKHPIKNIIKGLEKLYMGCLKDWHRVLKTGGKVVMALPEYNMKNKKYFVKKVIDSCEMLGYTTLAGPIEYGRPQAIVKREFFVFQKNGTH